MKVLFSQLLFKSFEKHEKIGLQEEWTEKHCILGRLHPINFELYAILSCYNTNTIFECYSTIFIFSVKQSYLGDQVQEFPLVQLYGVLFLQLVHL